MNVSFLRTKYPRFIYEKYYYKIQRGNLKIFFLFEAPPDIQFCPQLIIKNVTKSNLLTKTALDNLVFHLGLMEIPSYWKATCSPIIEIQAGHLNKKQIKWWQNLFIKGMGQFFYENKIDWRSKSFLIIKSLPKTSSLSVFDKKLKNRYLMPFAGGKDSIVTLECLKRKKGDEANASSLPFANARVKEIALFMVNPTKRILKTAEVSGIKKQIIIRRTIDKKILQLNKKGYLNGHTPFTALLSFLTVLCAVLFDYKNIIFSNEKSADEGNVKYLGEIINHQWAKSSEFEKMFKKYCRKYLEKNINYFSYLRKYEELKISRILTKYPKYFSFFSSCNASMKIGAKSIRWCANCPKCLFVYATFYPFLKKEQLLKIFGADIFENKKLLPAMKELLEQGRVKPFECVGTKKESLVAFYLSWKKSRGRVSINLPFLLKYFEKNILPKYPDLEKESKKILNS